ncbi:MAG TPA: CHAP domain-containing protein [Allosphingosinicella sp.]|nr:CHAP domain-containing protein [Allosphingosinicella sp.]
MLAIALLAGAATPAAAALQCVPYARAQSGIDTRGNAGTWWGQAEGRYRRGAEPEVGAVLAFRPSRAMPIGHVAVVAEIVDERTIYLNHANWSGPGRIERRALAVDVSAAGDWSEVRVWYAPQGSLGLRANATFGFIYNETPNAPPSFASNMTMADVSSTVAALGTN